VAAARATVGGVTHEHGRVRIAPGTRLDFDGIAKGYAVDACVARLRAARVRRAFVSFGESSLYALGAPPTAAAWEVAVRGLDPDAAVGTLHLRDQAVSVSGTRSASGRRGTIVDPTSGNVLDSDRVAVVVAASATDAEAYSKALLVWGPAGLARLERIGDVQAAVVSERGAELGPGMRAAAVYAPLSAPRPLRRAEEGLS
jgi:thiamine biosynthesis lipoprotein